MKRIVTQSRHLYHNSGRDRVLKSSVQTAEELRRHLITIFVLLRKGGGFSNSQRSWTQHDINLTTHLVASFYLLQDSGFHLSHEAPAAPSREQRKGSKSDQLLVNFMAACFMLFNDDTGLVQLPDRTGSDVFSIEEADDFLRDFLAISFILFNGGSSSLLALPSSHSIDEELARRLRSSYSDLLSRAGGIKLPFKGQSLHLLFLCLFIYLV